MEDVDKITLQILRHAGCHLAPELASVANFDDQIFYHVTSHCLNVAKPELKLEEALPSAKAARFRVTSTLAAAIKDMGFNGEMGYQSFLYPNEKDMRKLLSWLMEKLPKLEKADEGEGGLLGSSAGVASRSISDALAAWSKQRWTVLNTGFRKQHFESIDSRRICIPCTADDKLDLGGAAAAAGATKSASSSSSSSRCPQAIAYYSTLQPFAPAQLPVRAQVAPSFFEHNARELLAAEEQNRSFDASSSADAKQLREGLQALLADAFRTSAAQKRNSQLSLADMASNWAQYGVGGGSAFSRKADFAQEKGDLAGGAAGGGATKLSQEELDAQQRAEEEALREAREKELAELQASLDALLSSLKQMESEVDANLALARRLEADVLAGEERNKQLENAYKVKNRVLELLPNAEENMKKLQQMADDASQRLMTLGMEWEQHRAPLVAKYRRKKQLMLERKDDIAVKVEQIKRMRAEMKEKVAEVREKDELYKQLVDEFNKLPQSINRQVYVKRIMDIVKSLEKQKVDINNILDDVKKIQREINSKSDSAKRSFDVADEVVFQVAKQKKDPTATQVYKHIVDLRNGFEDIISRLEEAGKSSTEARELQQRIETLEARNTNLNMSRVAADLEQVRKENKELADQLRARGGVLQAAPGEGGAAGAAGEDEEEKN